jgi:DNA-binding response OmpR family regulator
MAEPVHADARILIVDDEPSIVRLLTRALEDTGYSSTQGFTDATMALAKFDAISPDLIVLDINMPIMTGYDFLSDLSQRLNEDTFLPVLMISGLPGRRPAFKPCRRGPTTF